MRIKIKYRREGREYSHKLKLPKWLVYDKIISIEVSGIVDYELKR